MKVFAFIMLAVMQVLIALIPILGKPSEENNSKFRVTKWGISIMLFLIIGLGLTIAIFFISEDEQNDAKAQFEEKLSHRDSLHEKREDSLSTLYSHKVDSSYNKSIKSSNEALAKYNLVLIDSLHRVATNIKTISGIPQLTMVGASQNSLAPIFIDNHDLVSQFTSSIATSYSLYVNCYITSLVNDELLYFRNLFDHDKLIVPGITTTSRVPIPDIVLSQDSVAIILIGNFAKDPLGKDTLSFKEAYIFNVKKNHISYGFTPNYAHVREWLHRRDKLNLHQ